MQKREKKSHFDIDDQYATYVFASKGTHNVCQNLKPLIYIKVSSNH